MDVATLLNSRGYDASWGYDWNDPSTLNRAIRQFQLDNGLTVDGIVGPQTTGALMASGMPGQTYAAQTPSAVEFATWMNQRRQLADTYGTTTAQNSFQRGNVQADQATNVQRMGVTQGWETENLPNAFIRRGLWGSGIQKQAEQNLQTKQGWVRSDSANQYQRMLGQIALNQQGASTAYTGGMAGVDSIEAARRSDLASQIRGL